MTEKRKHADLKRLHVQLGEVVQQMTRVHFSRYCPPKGWRPAVNVYRLQGGLQICVDLAGVDRPMIDLTVERGRLLLRGNRRPPEPAQGSGQALQILTMEIDCGPFERELTLPPQVDAERVSAEYRNGMLWIHLPLRSQA